MAQGGQDSADDIEHDKADMPHDVFDIIAEDPEVEHVPEQMHPAAVEKHAGEQCQHAGKGDHISGNRGLSEDDGGNGAVLKDEGFVSLARERRLIQKHERTDGDDRNGNEGGAFGRVVVVQWEHGAGLGRTAAIEHRSGQGRVCGQRPIGVEGN